MKIFWSVKERGDYRFYALPGLLEGIMIAGANESIFEMNGPGNTQRVTEWRFYF